MIDQDEPQEAMFEVGDMWRGLVGTRTILAVYDRDLLVVYEYEGTRDTLILPKWLFTNGSCGTKVTPDAQAECAACDGRGERPVIPTHEGDGRPVLETSTCPDCDGRGYIERADDAR